jgi:hypothetical protein
MILEWETLAGGGCWTASPRGRIVLSTMKRPPRPLRRLIWAGALLAVIVLLLKWFQPAASPPVSPVSGAKEARHLGRRGSNRTFDPLSLHQVFDAGAISASTSFKGDLLLALMPTQIKHTAMVFEVNALMNSPLGQPLLDCIYGPRASFLAIMGDSGVDVHRNIDRVSVVDGHLTFEGSFRGADWSRIMGHEAVVEAYGQFGKIFRLPPGSRLATALVWNERVIVWDGTESDQRLAVDKLEGRAPPSDGPPAVHSAMVYGEAYGVVTAAGMAEALQLRDGPAKDTLLGLLQRADVQMWRRRRRWKSVAPPAAQ